MIQVLLADDHKLVRDGLKSLLHQKTQDIQVVAEAATGTQVLSQLETIAVDVVLMDIDMPQMNGIEATRRIREHFPQVKVLMLTMADNEQWARESMAAGAQGYLLKRGGHKELFLAIRSVHEGEEYFSSDLTKLLLRQVNASSSQAAAAAPGKEQGTSNGQAITQPLSAGISPRELEVLQLIAQGYTNTQIGELLFNSKRTVETHRQNLLTKTGTNNTATLIRYALEHKLLKEQA